MSPLLDQPKPCAHTAVPHPPASLLMMLFNPADKQAHLDRQG